MTPPDEMESNLSWVSAVRGPRETTARIFFFDERLKVTVCLVSIVTSYLLHGDNYTIPLGSSVMSAFPLLITSGNRYLAQSFISLPPFIV